MAVFCQSKFAVLRLEDDDILEGGGKKSNANKTQTSKNKANAKPANDAKKLKKKKKANEISELQSLAFATNSKSKQKGATHNSKAVPASEKQWEEWKQKDAEFVSESYEQDLQEALILSKIDYEEKKDVYDALKKEAELNKLAGNKKKKGNRQKKDKGTMSLDEFQNSGGAEKDQRDYGDLDDFDSPKKSPPVPNETNFFEKIVEEKEKIITKEHQMENCRPVDPKQESARFHQFQEDLRIKDEEINSLKDMVKKLKEELKNVKSRNKKLYEILGSGEMREKADILLQIDQLTSVREELTEQLSEYHTNLEQERSKVHSLQMELKKYQNNKKQRTESK